MRPLRSAAVFGAAGDRAEQLAGPLAELLHVRDIRLVAAIGIAWPTIPVWGRRCAVWTGGCTLRWAAVYSGRRTATAVRIAPR